MSSEALNLPLEEEDEGRGAKQHGANFPRIWVALVTIFVALFALLTTWGVARKSLDGRALSATLQYELVRIMSGAVAVVIVFAVSRRFSSEAFIFRDSPAMRERPFSSKARKLSLVAIAAVAAGTVIRIFSGDPASWTPVELLALLVFGLTVAAWEEIAFRGLLLSALRHRYSEASAWWWSSFAFSIVHLTAGPVVALVCLASGSSYYLARRLTGNLWLSIVLHAATDISIWWTLGIVASPAQTAGTQSNFGVLVVFLGYLLTIVSLAMIRWPSLRRRGLPT
ncbi:MAG: CPBP family intramembrane glutamic endopeptidase [Actinomycetes bacterium]